MTEEIGKYHTYFGGIRVKLSAGVGQEIRSHLTCFMPRGLRGMGPLSVRLVRDTPSILVTNYVQASVTIQKGNGQSMKIPLICTSSP